MQPAGYIVIDNNATVWGYGPTADAAWESARAELTATWGGARDTLTDDEMHGYSIRAATQTLIDTVIERGGDLPWRDRNGVACTVAEYEAERA